MSKDIKKIILFRLGDSWWSMPLSEDSQFVHFDNIVALPIDNKVVAGLIYNAGRIITVLDSSKVLGLKKNINNKLCLIFYSNGDFYALTIDEGGDTVDVPRLMVDKNKNIFREYANIKERKVYILRPEDIWKIAKI